MKAFQEVALVVCLTVALFGGSARAGCPDFANQTSYANAADAATATVSGLAFGQYFLRAQAVGGGSATLTNVSISANPGTTWSNGYPGFVGTGTTLTVSYFVQPVSALGSTGDIVVEVYTLLGTLVCTEVFTVQVVRPPGWTPWMSRDTASGSGDYEFLADFDPILVCPNPIAIECRTTGGIPYQSAGQVYTCNVASGGVCRHADQSGFVSCYDYEIRIYCP